MEAQSCMEGLALVTLIQLSVGEKRALGVLWYYCGWMVQGMLREQDREI